MNITNNSKVHKRIISYIALFVFLALVYFILRDSTWQGNKQFHTIMELLATVLAAFVGTVALVRFYSKKNNTFLFVGTGFVGTAFLDGYHTIVTSTFFDTYFPSHPPSLIPWSWNASRIFLSILLFLSWWAWRKEERFGEAGRISERGTYVVVAGLTLASFLFFAFVPLPRAYYPELFFGRPEEFVSASFFLLAFVGYLKKGFWRKDDFEYWMVLSLIVGFMGQAMFMSFSYQLFDTMFDTAHLLKKVSYIFVLTGLLISVYQMFKQADESEARIRAVVDNVFAGLITIDERGTIETFNPAAERIFGYDSAEVIGHNVKMLMPEPYVGEHDSYLSNYLRTGRAKIIGIGREVVGLRKNGTTFPLDLAVTESIFGERHKFFGAVRDITERKRVEKALADALTYSEGIVDAISDGLWIIDREARNLSCNDVFLQMIRYTRDEFLSLSAFDVISEKSKDTAENAIGQVFEGKKVYGVEIELVRKEGSTFAVELTGSPIFRSGEIVSAQGIIRDVSAKKEVDQMKTEFISTVSHELRTPLTSIRGYVDMILDGDTGEINDDQRKFLKIVDRNTERLSDLINNLLDVEKIESGRIKFAREPVDMEHVLNEAITTFRVAAEGKGLSFDVSIEKVPKIIGDHDRLVQVFSNLLSNSIKYTQEGGITLKAHAEGNEVHISITDTGVGISEHDLPKLFTKFFRADTTYIREVGGTGLGLSIVKAILDAHQGTIKFSSKLGAGTSVDITLPIDLH
ncbi:MAG: PAS domain S-box protein [Candidatus Marinimicrobia bacterium]|nr:PAS domain S-box protein [Candidatus Neomarinimicrobiota bacterium]